MVFWAIAAVLTSAVILWITRPLSVGDEEGSDAKAVTGAEADLAVYRDQLAEIETDLTRGTLNASEAEAARIEISRRLLHAAEQADAQLDPAVADGAATTSGAWWRRPANVAALATAVTVPILGLGIYLSVGAPGLPDQPQSARLAIPVDQITVTELIARVEARLKEHPDDIRGWEVIAPVYLRQGRMRDARAAFQRAIEIDGETAGRLAGLVQATVALTQGRVTDELMAMNRRLIALDPTRAEPKFWVALGLEQRGQFAEAREGFRSLISPETRGQPWRPAVEQRLAALDARLGTGPQNAETPDRSAPQPGPTREDVAAANAMSPEDRQAMIEGMVSGLAARLSESGGSVDEWSRLIRAYVVLGQTDKAEAAAKDARLRFAEDAEASARLAALSDRLGLGAEPAQPTAPPSTSERRDAP